MAYYYKGDGFQLQQQLGGYNLATQAWNNARQNNIFTDANNLISNLQYNNARRALLETANPYDGLTTYQKLQQLGLENNYVLNDLDKLEAAYNAETSNIKAARQAASDFNTESLLAEAYRVRATGDPAQIQAFNNKLAREVNLTALVASGAVTPETAGNLLTPVLPVKQQVATEKLTNAQAAAAYGNAAESAANARATNLASDRLVYEQNSIDDAQALLNSRGTYVTSFSSALRAGNALGYDLPRTIRAWNALQNSPYFSSYFAEGPAQIGSSKINLLDQAQQNALNGQTNIQNKGVMPNQEQQNIGTEEASTSTASNTSEGDSSKANFEPKTAQQATKNRLDVATERAKELEEAVKSNSKIVTKGQVIPDESTSTSNANNQTAVGTPQTNQENINDANSLKSTDSSTSTIDKAAEAASGNKTATPVDTKQSSTETDTPVQSNTQSAGDTNLDNKTAASNSKTNDASSLVGENNTTSNDDSTKLNQAAEQASSDKNIPKVEYSNQQGGSYTISTKDDLLFDKKTGKVIYNDRLPKNKTNTFGIRRMDTSFKDMNITTGNNLANIIEAGVDDSNNVVIGYTDLGRRLIKDDPESKEAFDYALNTVAKTYADLAKDPESRIAATSYMLKNFGKSEAVRLANQAIFDNVMAASDKLYNTDFKQQNIAENYAYPEITSLGQTNKTIINPLVNEGSNANTDQKNLNFLSNILSQDPEAIAVNISTNADGLVANVESNNGVINDLKAEIKPVATLEKIYNSIKGNNGDLQKSFVEWEKSGDPELANTVESMIRAGILHRLPVEEKGVNAESYEKHMDYSIKYTGEALTTLMERAEALRSNYAFRGMTTDAALACVLLGGLVGTRSLPNSWFNSLTDTNTMFTFNDDASNNAASIYLSRIANPDGYKQYTQLNTVLNDYDTAFTNLKSQRDIVKANAAKLTTLRTDLQNAGFTIRNYQDEANNWHVQLISDTGYSDNYLKGDDGEKKLETLKTNLNTLRRSIDSLNKAGQTLSMYGIYLSNLNYKMYDTDAFVGQMNAGITYSGLPQRTIDTRQNRNSLDVAAEAASGGRFSQAAASNRNLKAVTDDKNIIKGFNKLYSNYNAQALQKQKNK